MKVKYYTCDVFTDKKFGGNQLAVFPNAQNIPEQFLPQITKEFNFSETTFVYPPAIQSELQARKVRIFTPGAELPFAGHPTLGTAFVLASIGDFKIVESETNVVLEESVGNVPVKIFSENNNPKFIQLTAAKLPEFFSAPSINEIAEFLSLSADEMDEAFPAEIVSCGVPFLFAAVKSREIIKRIRINTQKMENMLQSFAAKDMFVFTTETEQSDSHFHARMFAPLLGIPEDPATGSAAASFAGYLAAKNSLHNGTLKWKIEQGFEMGRPSLLFIEADKQNEITTAIRVGGNVVMMCEGEMEI